MDLDDLHRETNGIHITDTWNSIFLELGGDIGNVRKSSSVEDTIWYIGMKHIIIEIEKNSVDDLTGRM